MAETSLRRLFRAHLRRAGYTAEELSRFLNVTPSTLSKWVNGYNPWPDDALPIIFEILGLDQAQQDEFYALVVASRSGSDAVTVNPIAARENPYRGLFSFREEDAADFFGREAFIQRLVKTVQDRPLVAVIGSSGSGKSSVIFAGLVPRLRQSNDWVIIDFRPGSDPFQALAAVLLPQYESYQTETEKLIESRRLAESLRHRELPLSDVINLIQHNESPNTRLLLVADQFEELYTLCPEPETQRRFLDILIDTFLPDPRPPTASPRHHLILSLRADFLGQALAYRPFADALQDTDLKLGPMNQTELRQSIEEPALKHRVTFEAGLVERIINDVGHPVGNLPLLEFALAELWVRQAKGRLTHAAYEAIGQAQGALTRYADETYAQLGQREQEQARRIFTQMVQPRQGAEDTRRPVTKAELGEHEWALVQKLADARLLVTNLNPDNQQAAEMVHEAFIRNWQLLRVWIEQDRDFRIWQESFRVHLRQWLNTKNEGDYLSGTHLAEAEVWLKKRAPDLSTVEKDFIRQSLDNAGTRKRSIVLFFALAGGLGAAVGSTVITALAGYFLFASDPDNPLFRSLPQPLVMLVLGLIGALGGGMQGLVTTLGFTLADVLAVKPTWRYRLFGSLLGGGLFGGCLLLVLRMAEAMPSTYSYITAFMFGFIMFGLSSGAITGAIPGIRDQGPLLRQVILGGILPSLACFGAVGLSFLLLDLGQGTAFLETALGYAALEGAFGAGMALGLGVASTRLGYMLQ